MLKPYFYKDKLEVGLDEAGRGPLLGRVYVAAVILPHEGLDTRLLKDSKKLSERKRLMAFDYVKEIAIDYSVKYKEVEYIDEYNIFKSNYNAMHDAIDELLVRPEHILVDGNYFKTYMDKNGDYISHTTIVKGDDKYLSIAAASILAKVSRDKYILDLCDKYPKLDEMYGIKSNKGYGSRQHMEGLDIYGITKWHRKSFKCCSDKVVITL
jgi:ribonuclease HII